jgi:hypothetical protein
MTSPFDVDPNSPQPTERDKFERAAKYVRDFMMRSDRYRKPHIELAQECRDLYQCWVREGKSLIGRANLKLPYAYSIVEGQIPQVVEALLKERPLAKFEGTDEQDMQFEDSMADYCDMQVEDMKFPLKAMAYTKGMLLDGTAFAKVPYRFEERVIRRKEYIDVPQANGPARVEVTLRTELRVVFDGPDFEFIPFVDAFPDWAHKVAGDVQGMRGFAHRTYKTFSQLEGNKKYKNLDELRHSTRVKGCKAWAAPYYSEENQGTYDAHNDNERGIKNQDLIEVWEFWGLFDVTGRGDFEEYVITVANGDVAIRCEENPFDHQFKPFLASPNVVRDGEFFGIPELIAIRPLVKEANALRNARLDQINLAVNRMYVVDRAAGIKHRNLYTRPGGIIWTNDVNGIRELPPPEVPPSATRELQELQMEMKEALGVLSGVPQLSQAAKTFGRSATGAQLVNSITASRVGLKLRILAETMIKPMTQIQLQINDQFVTDEQWARATDPNRAAQNPFTLLPTEAFRKATDFRIKTALDTGGDESEMARMQQLAQFLQVAEGTQPGITKWNELFESIGRTLVGPRYKKFMRSDQERMQMQAQGMAMQEAAAAQAGAAAPQPNAGGAAAAPIDPGIPSNKP